MAVGGQSRVYALKIRKHDIFTNTESNSTEENGGDKSGAYNFSANEAKPANGPRSKELSASATTETAKSAAAEIVVPQEAAKPDPVGDAIKKCKEVAEGGNVFEAAKAHIFVGLTAAYAIFLLIKENKVEHQRVIDELMAKGNRERMPSLNKPAYNSTVLACHPDNPESWSLCSDWANVLARAEIEKVSSEAFAVWVKDKTIRESKLKVRAFKQAAKMASKPLKTPFVESDFPALAHVFKHSDDERIRQLIEDELTKLDEQMRLTLTAMDVVVA